ncbi:Metallothiol transferase FosB [Alphaproteobacteria bacterium SO-S41]|nr:Metallothiol transferase FosB [Alphaproteobacteria bacterium SO-S41]
MKTTGINHVAMVCRDMEETVKFYTEVLDMPLYKTVELPDGGQHFFFDCGNGNSIAFFFWADGPAAAPGVASVRSFPGDSRTAVGSMNHLAFDVPEEKLEEYRQRLEKAGVAVFPMVMNHDDSPATVSATMHPGVFVRSVYFTDPNGIMMEFAATTKVFGPEDVRHTPGRALAPAEA